MALEIIYCTDFDAIRALQTHVRIVCPFSFHCIDWTISSCLSKVWFTKNETTLLLLLLHVLILLYLYAEPRYMYTAVR